MEKQKPEFITIKDKSYKIADLSQDAINIANNFHLVQNEIRAKQTEIGIYQLASDHLVAQLVDATSSLTPVVIPTQEAQAQEAK